MLNMGIVKAFGKQDLAGAGAAWQQVIATAPDSPEAQAARKALDGLQQAHPGGGHRPERSTVILSSCRWRVLLLLCLLVAFARAGRGAPAGRHGAGARAPVRARSASGDRRSRWRRIRCAAPSSCPARR